MARRRGCGLPSCAFKENPNACDLQTPRQASGSGMISTPDGMCRVREVGVY